MVSTCSSLPPNGTCSVGITASPTQATNRFATLTLSDSTGTVQQTASLRVLGMNPGPVANPDTLAFAYTPQGSVSAPQSFTITSYNNDPVTVTVGAAQFVPFFLTQGSSCTRTPCQISVAFAPTAATVALADDNNSYDTIFVTDLFSGQAGGVSVSGINQAPPPPPPTTADLWPADRRHNQPERTEHPNREYRRSIAVLRQHPHGRKHPGLQPAELLSKPREWSVHVNCYVLALRNWIADSNRADHVQYVLVFHSHHIDGHRSVEAGRGLAPVS
jgi:hypothetical protein